MNIFTGMACRLIDRCRAFKKKIGLYRRIRKNIKKQNKTYFYLEKKYLRPYLISTSPDFSLLREKERIVWQYWDSGIDGAPLVVRSSIKSVQDNLPDGYKHIVLNDKNLHEYVEIPDWIMDKRRTNREFRTVFFSDILRLYLLEKYGGVWIDATIFMSAQIPGHVLNSSFFVFYRGEEPAEREIYERFDPNYFSWRKEFKVKLCNSFIVADRGHPFLTALKDILVRYWKEENTFRHYFILQMLFEQLIKVEPYSNVKWDSMDDLDIHRMQFEMGKSFTKERWDRLRSLCFAHKLSYKFVNKEKKIHFSVY